MDLKERMRQRRKELGLTLEDVAKAVGTTRQTIQKYESGTVSNIPADKIEKIAAVLKTTPEYLMGWSPRKENYLQYANILPLPRTRKVPRLGTIACGEPLLAVENIEEYDDTPENIPCDFTLVCKGDSMEGARILDGDIVYIRQQEEVENGEIAAVLIGEEATLKRVYRENGQLLLMPANPRYTPLVYAGERLREVRILGKAVHFTSAIH